MSQPTREELLRFFEYKHLPPPLQRVSSVIYHAAEFMVDNVPPSAERSAGLRKLLEAKDCFVRAAMPTVPL